MDQEKPVVEKPEVDLNSLIEQDRERRLSAFRTEMDEISRKYNISMTPRLVVQGQALVWDILLTAN